MPGLDSNIKSNEFRSHGKLLLSGEYLVLQGATAFATPLTFGQTLQVDSEPSLAGSLQWQTWVHDQLVLEAEINVETLEVMNHRGTLSPDNLIEILKTTRIIKPDFPGKGWVHKAISKIDFDLNLGFGSSSSLISNIAWWAGVDPYFINKVVFGGSGYDIACARAASPILFNPGNDAHEIMPAGFHPDFTQHLYIIFSGHKQDTRQAISYFKEKRNAVPGRIKRISEISRELATATRLDGFENLINEHEAIMAQILGVIPVKFQKFADFPGSIKSLGAWGGDCWLATWRGSPQEIANYFGNKGYKIIFPFRELSLNS